MRVDITSLKCVCLRNQRRASRWTSRRPQTLLLRLANIRICLPFYLRGLSVIAAYSTKCVQIHRQVPSMSTRSQPTHDVRCQRIRELQFNFMSTCVSLALLGKCTIIDLDASQDERWLAGQFSYSAMIIVAHGRRNKGQQKS